MTSPKTEHHPGKGTRLIPLFPELREILEEAFEAAPEGAVYVVNERYRKSAMGKNGWRNCNLRTTFEKIIRRAGLTPWPRLFHNLRASRETELTERFPIHVVTAWLGNTPEIARKHYLQVTDDHFQAATATDGALLQALRQPAATTRKSSQNGVDDTKRKRVVATSPQEPNVAPCEVLRQPANLCDKPLQDNDLPQGGEDRIRTTARFLGEKATFPSRATHNPT